MLRTITQKCPCGYLFKEEKEIETRIDRGNFTITCKAGCGPVVNFDKPTRKDHIIKRTVLRGDKEFKKLYVLTDCNFVHRENKKSELLVCPKCGTVLISEIAMTVDEIEE